jgi:hypothetical protein
VNSNRIARFADVIAHAGPPKPHTLWRSPANDRAFQTALKNCRVLTVHQSNVGSKKDYGAVGYEKDPHALFLVFPRSLKRFAGKRIVGIRYDQLQSEAT